MDSVELQSIIQNIVKDAEILKDKHTDQIDIPVSYVCIFAHSEEKYQQLRIVADQMGHILEETDKGPVFHINPLPTVAGDLKILKIRMPFANRPERGDADFTVRDFEKFKKTYLYQPGFNIIVRPNFEMIELADPKYDVLAYFSNPPVDQQYRKQLSGL